MENTKNKLPENTKTFINKLKNYLNTKIYFYGSIQRDDYFVGESEIDITIFSDNTEAMISKILHYLHIKKNKVNKIFWHASLNNRLIQGYKLMYNNENEDIKLEITIYDDKYKKYVLYDEQIDMNLPLYISFMLIFLKVMYYNLKILPSKYYIKCKRILFNYVKGNNSLFLSLNNFLH
jgi:hypothetical protein